MTFYYLKSSSTMYKVFIYNYLHVNALIYNLHGFNKFGSIMFPIPEEKGI